MAKRRQKAEAAPKPAQQVPAAPRPLTDAERAELLAWGEHIARQPQPPCFKADGKGALTGADGVDRDLHFARIVAAFGTANNHAINLLNVAAETSDGSEVATKYNTAAALARASSRATKRKACSPCRWSAVTTWRWRCCRRATTTDRVDFLATYGNLAAKLLRTFTHADWRRWRGCAGRPDSRRCASST